MKRLAGSLIAKTACDKQSWLQVNAEPRFPDACSARRAGWFRRAHIQMNTPADSGEVILYAEILHQLIRDDEPAAIRYITRRLGHEMPFWYFNCDDPKVVGDLLQYISSVEKGLPCLLAIKRSASDQLLCRLAELADKKPSAVSRVVGIEWRVLKYGCNGVLRLKSRLGMKHIARMLSVFWAGSRPTALYYQYSIAEALALLLSPKQKKQVYRLCDPANKKYLRALWD